MKNYVWDASNYSKNSFNQLQWAKELIPKLKLTGKEKMLDIGCGDGKVTADLARNLPKGAVLGIDNSQDMINLAKASFPKKSYPNLSFQRMDARELDFEEQFDRVFSNAALHWIIDHRPVLWGVYKSLKVYGRLLFQMGGKGNVQEVFNILDMLRDEPAWKKFFEGFSFPFGFYEPKEYCDWLRIANLKPERVELISKELKFSGVEEVAGWIRTTWLPYTERIPVDQRDEFIGELVERILAKYSMDEEGFVHLKVVRLEVEATKTC